MKTPLLHLHILALRSALDPVIKELVEGDFETVITKTPNSYIYEIIDPHAPIPTLSTPPEGG